MIGIPPWKVRRELKRVGRQIGEFPTELLRRLYFRRWYDLVTSRAIHRTEGALSLGREVAIYLIYPVGGLLASHLHMLAELRRAGISPLVVSNLPLTEAHRETLREHSALIIERPNVGYDFGGYRDGVLELKEFLSQLDSLWLFNDSVWMLPQSKSWFDDARALNVDFVGATSNFAMPRVDVERFREITWMQSTDHKNFHYASYALSMGENILRNPDFLRYWNKLEIRNNKKRTVRRGEIGLTQWVLRHGYSHRATCEIGMLDRELAALDDSEIEVIAQDLVIPEDDRLITLKNSVLQSDHTTDQGRADRVALILTAVSRQASVYALPGYMLPYRGFQFLKKSPLVLNIEGSKIMLRLIARLEARIGPEITEEAQRIAY